MIPTTGPQIPANGLPRPRRSPPREQDPSRRLLTGDRASVAEAVGSALQVDRVYAEQIPEGKLDVVRALGAHPELRPVIMVGDGINDAPARDD
jgi:P-type E1-E2 ATPase